MRATPTETELRYQINPLNSDATPPTQQPDRMWNWFAVRQKRQPQNGSSSPYSLSGASVSSVNDAQKPEQPVAHCDPTEHAAAGAYLRPAGNTHDTANGWRPLADRTERGAAGGGRATDTARAPVFHPQWFRVGATATLQQPARSGRHYAHHVAPAERHVRHGGRVDLHDLRRGGLERWPAPQLPAPAQQCQQW